MNKMVPYDDFLAVSQGTAAAASGNSYLPAVDPCSCQVHSDSDWISKISDASTSFYEALMGPAGVATKAMCFDEIQTQYDNAFRTSTVSSAPAFAKDLAQKVGLKFEARYEQAEKLRDEAEDYYGEETLNSSPPDAFCMDQCNSCKYDSSFFSEVDRTKYGVRWGARADEENTAARVESEDVVQVSGEERGICFRTRYSIARRGMHTRSMCAACVWYVWLAQGRIALLCSHRRPLCSLIRFFCSHMCISLSVSATTWCTPSRAPTLLTRPRSGRSWEPRR